MIIAMSTRKKMSIEKRIIVFFSALLCVIVVVAGRIGWIQFIDGKNMASKTATQLRESKALYSPRGTIYDRNGRELAISSMTKSIC